MRQRAHFIRHYCKTTPGITGARGFDRGVEREQIGLFGNRANHVQHFADAMNLLRQRLDLRGIVGDIAGEKLDRRHRLLHLLAPLPGDAVGLAGGFGRGHGVVRHLFHRRRHLVDRSGGLLDFLALLMQATSSIFGNAAQLFGRRGQLRGRLGDPPDRVAQIVLHAFQRLQQARRLVFANDVNVTGQIPAGHDFGHAERLRQWHDNAARQQQRQADGNQRSHGDHYCDPQPRLLEDQARCLSGETGILLVQLDQLTQGGSDFIGQRTHLIIENRRSVCHPILR